MKVLFKRFVVIVSCVFFVSACDQQVEEEVTLTVEEEATLPLERAVMVSDEAFNLAQHPLQPDPELGVATARLGEGVLHQTDLTLVEIPPSGQLPPIRHLAEEMIYIVAGEGYTTMWTRPGEQPQRYEWSAGDMLTPSLNAWHQHFNTSSDTAARYVSMTTTPLTNNLFHNQEFLSSSEFVFEDRWQMGITQQLEYKARDDDYMRGGHHLPDLPGRELQMRKTGRPGITIRPEGELAGNHILEMFVREYHSSDMGLGLPSRGDKHPWEVVYLVLEGEGSSILKRSDEPARQVNWEKNDLFIVEADEAHHMGARIGAELSTPYPRLMQIKPAGYFDGVGNVGNTERTNINVEDVLTVE